MVLTSNSILRMPNPKNKEPESYSSVLKNIRELAGKKKASALLPLMRTMTKYLHKADSELIEATIHHILIVLVFCWYSIHNCTSAYNPHR